MLETCVLLLPKKGPICPDLDLLSPSVCQLASLTWFVLCGDFMTAGQTVLILGAAGGVGVAAVQICKVLGAKVVAVARGESKAKLLTELGADAVIDTSAHHQVSLAQTNGQTLKHHEHLVLMMRIWIL